MERTCFEPNVKEKSGAELVVETLERIGVQMAFGYPGGAILPIYDVLYDSQIKHILTRHEQAAIHAAEGYARANGSVGVVFATSGPGATNLVTGITDAFMDSVPLLVITGQVATSLIGRDGFQEADVMGITTPITKYNYQIQNVREIPEVIASAYRLAQSGRPGPVLIDIPKDVQAQTAQVTSQEPNFHHFHYQVRYQPESQEIESVANALTKSKKPLLYVGGGVVNANAAPVLRRFARQNQIPVVSTLMGLGAFPAHDPLFLGMLGMHGTYAANMAITECDFLIACGVRFDDRVTGKLEAFSPNSVKVHIDIDPAEINKNVRIDYPVVADVKAALEALVDQEIIPPRTSWLEQVNGWKEEHPLTYSQKELELKPQHVIHLLSEMTDGQAIVTTEVGQHQMWTAHFYQVQEPRKFITSGGLGTMGFGFPAAIGAQLAKAEETVVCIAGDASFQMNIQELQTIAEQNLPVKVFVINNRFLGMVRQWQEMFYENRLSESRIGAPDFARIAEAYGVKGMRAKTPSEAEEAIQLALQHPGPVVIDFLVVEEENVFPMVPPGKANNELITKRWEE